MAGAPSSPADRWRGCRAEPRPPPSPSTRRARPGCWTATGDTVWTRPARAVTFPSTNRVGAPGRAAAAGAMRLAVVVPASDGWSAALTSGSVARLQGGPAPATVAVDPQGAARLLDRHF